MAEQNAHDDERDTADLATNDAADLAAGDATDLAADDASRPQAPAGQLTPAGCAVGPSPSPTPTFAATDRPARRARRLRWKPGITRPMMALSAASFALMIAGVGGYVSAIPAVVADDRPSAVIIPLESALWLDGQMREVQVGPVGSTRAVGPVTIEASKTDAVAPDAAAALGLGSGSGSGMLGVASLTGASAASSVDSSFTRAQQIAGGASAASGSGSASGSASSGGSSQAGSGSAGAVPRPVPVRVRAAPAVRAARRMMQAARARARKALAAPVPHLRLPRPRPSRRRRHMPCWWTIRPA